MKPRTAKQEFLDRLKQAGFALTGLNPADGIEQMLAFYRDERADGCDLGEDGDMLLYQWTGDEDERTFELDITRQMTEAGKGDDDGPMRQLSLTFRFRWDDELAKLGDGDRWCETPGRLEKFRAFVEKSKPYKALAGRKPAKVSLVLDRV